MCWVIPAFLIVLICLFLGWLLRSLSVANFESKFVLISGCDSGFGKSLALKLDELGFQVFAGCLTKDGERVLNEKGSKRLRAVQLNVSCEESIQKCFHFISEALPPGKGLWALVNNAGIAGELGPPDLNTVEGVRKTLDVNLYGPIAICHQFLPLIRQSKGRIINMTSMCGRFPAGAGPYNASKHGLEGYSDILRREMYHQGVKVCMLEPSYFKTQIFPFDGGFRNLAERMENAHPDVKAIYGDSFSEKYSQGVNNVKAHADPDLSPVISAYLHAITARFPCTRYPVGFNAKYIVIPLSYIPDFILNLIVPKLLKIN